jgi:hypothetical protein
MTQQLKPQWPREIWPDDAKEILVDGGTLPWITDEPFSWSKALEETKANSPHGSGSAPSERVVDPVTDPESMPPQFLRDLNERRPAWYRWQEDWWVAFSEISPAWICFWATALGLASAILVLRLMSAHMVGALVMRGPA